MTLPTSRQVDVSFLAACFRNTVSTYKFYWLLSILCEIEQGNSRIKKIDLFARMIAEAWYTVNYFNISFGNQDMLQRAVKNVQRLLNLEITTTRTEVFNRIVNSKDPGVIKELWHFDKQVPHWFLSPWLPKRDRAAIYKSSLSFENECFYALRHDEILVNDSWLNYLTSNSGIVKNFCYWNLSLFLQAKNPNVPDIPNKLIKPATRRSLTQQRKNFWNLVLNNTSLNCIYTNRPIDISNYAVEHFVPYSFVSHDLLWNLIPADPIFNSSKSNKLPILEKYFDPFFEVQSNALKIMVEKDPKNKMLQDYLTLFPDIDNISNLSESFTKERFSERVVPLIRVANNNGFVFME